MSDAEKSRQSVVEEILAECSGRRKRVVDEHMYRPEGVGVQPAARLQLFTAAGLQPIVVATQDATETWLTTCPEVFCDDVWRVWFSEESRPPLWVQRRVPEPWQLVIFECADDGRLADHLASPLSQEQLERLVGVPVDPERGDGFVAPTPRPRTPCQYVVTPLSVLPAACPDKTACMRRVSGRRGGWWFQMRCRWWPRAERDCCQYHGVDWRAVNQRAVRLLRTAKRRKVPAEQVPGHVVAAAVAEGATGAELHALESLFNDPIVEGVNGYINGRHRVLAMRDAGVRTTVTSLDEDCYLPPC